MAYGPPYLEPMTSNRRSADAIPDVAPFAPASAIELVVLPASGQNAVDDLQFRRLDAGTRHTPPDAQARLELASVHVGRDTDRPDQPVTACRWNMPAISTSSNWSYPATAQRHRPLAHPLRGRRLRAVRDYLLRKRPKLAGLLHGHHERKRNHHEPERLCQRRQQLRPGL